jgi:hypothetical protein
MKAPRQTAQVDPRFDAKDADRPAGPAAKFAQDDGGNHAWAPAKEREADERLTELKT